MNRKPSTHNAIFDDSAFASKYAEKHQKMAQNLGKKYVQKLQKIGFKTGTLLDMGCGFGGTLLFIAEQFPGATCTGIDLSEPLLNMAVANCGEMGLSDRVGFKKMDVLKLEYENKSFDAVINLNMVHLVSDPLMMLNELARVIKPEGYYFIADLRRSWLGLIEKEIKSAYSIKEASEVLKKSNLSDGKILKDILWWYYESRNE
jgi:ubiquinone/menaquinone biosynthesis C-methylase UbiE